MNPSALSFRHVRQSGWRTTRACPEPFAVILSGAKDLFHFAQGKLREGYLALALTPLLFIVLPLLAPGAVPKPFAQAAAQTQSAKVAAGEAVATGYNLLARHDAAGAEAAFRQAIEALPESQPAHRGLGLALREEGKWVDALRELQVATRLDPGDADSHYALGMVAWSLSEQSSTAQGAGEKPEYRELAGREFNQALALQPRDASLRLDLAGFYLDAGRTHEAQDQAQEAVRLAPQNPAAHIILGRAYFAVGEEEKAAAEFDSAAKLGPGQGGAFLALGQLRLFQRKYPQAEQMFRRAIQASPQLAPAYEALAQVLVQDGRSAEARSLLEKAVALDPQDWQSQYQLAKLLMEAGEAGRATTMLEEVARARPDYLPAREQLALGLLRRGDLQGASSQAEALIARNPEAPEGHRVMALALWKQRNYENSLAECAQALNGDPSSASMLALQAIALWQLDRKKEAQNAFRQAAKVEPKVGSADVFCRLLACGARDIAPVTDFLHKNRWVLQPPEQQ